MEINIKEWLRTSGHEHAVERVSRMYSIPYAEAEAVVDRSIKTHPEWEVYRVKTWGRVLLSTLTAAAIAATIVILIISLRP